MSNLIHRYSHLGTATEGFKDRLASRTELVEDVLTRVVIDSIRRYQQKVQVGIQDSVSDLLATFKLKVADEIYQMSQNWSIATQREPILFPPDCRFLYNLGSSTIVVIEQSPTVRTLSLDTGLFRDSAVRTNQIEQRHLAMPYTIFVLHFRNTERDGSGKESFRNLYIGWRGTPLTSLDDVIYVPHLPNIYPGNYTVCTGQIDLVSDFTGSAAVTELTTKITSDFWNSVFNTDLASYWIRKNTIPEIATADEWQRNSREDPLFILKIPFRDPNTLIALIKTVCSATEGTAPDLRHRISDMTDSISERLFLGIKNYLLKTKFDRFYPKDVTDRLAMELEALSKQLRSVALGIEIQLNNMSEELSDMQSDDYRWRKRSPWWID